jgi:putative hydrolase of the HAD superfamily
VHYKAIFIDVGRTLVWVPPFADLYLQACQEQGVAVSLEALQVATKQVWDRIVLEDATVTFAPTATVNRHFWRLTNYRTLLLAGVEEKLAAIEERFQEILDDAATFPVFPEVPAALAALRTGGYVLGIVSNWGWCLPHLCRQLGLARYFDFILASSRVGCAKPHPGIFQRALAIAGVAPVQALHVGDSVYADVNGARAVGMDAILLDRSGKEHSDYPAIRALDELPAWLEAHS